MDDKAKAIGVGVIVLALVAFSFFYYRSVYAHAKRLRVVEPGRLYRSGQLTAAGFRDAVRRYGIRTIINVQDDVPDPLVWHGYLDRRTVRESAVCQELGVRYVWLAPDLQGRDVAQPRPKVLDEFLALMDDEATYPALIHCKAGLHRTGVLAAVYRMEYAGWSRAAAFRELKAHGFGEWKCSSANDYVDQYVLRYRPRRAGGPRAFAAAER
jgi:hypothetical protein